MSFAPPTAPWKPPASPPPTRRPRWPWVVLGLVIGLPVLAAAAFVGLWYLALQGPSPTGADQDRLDVLQAESILDRAPEDGRLRSDEADAGACCGPFFNASTDTRVVRTWALDEDDHLSSLRDFARAAADDGWTVDIPADTRTSTCDRVEARKDFGDWIGLLTVTADPWDDELEVALSAPAVAGTSRSSTTLPGGYQSDRVTLDEAEALARLCV